MRRPFVLRGDAASGRVTDAAGVPINPSGAIKQAIFVVALDGSVLCSLDLGKHHHASLVAGEDVIAAGTMRVSHGRLFEVDNASGHYRPPPASLSVFVSCMRRMGVSLEDVRFASVADHASPAVDRSESSLTNFGGGAVCRLSPHPAYF